MVVALLSREMTVTSVVLLSNLSNFVVLHRHSRWHVVCALVPCNDQKCLHALGRTRFAGAPLFETLYIASHQEMYLATMKVLLHQHI